MNASVDDDWFPNYPASHQPSTIKPHRSLEALKESLSPIIGDHMISLESKQNNYSIAETIEMLEESIELLDWVVARVPKSWHYRDPRNEIRGLRGDDRSVAIHIAHLLVYETDLANPVLEELARGNDGTAVAKSGSMSWRKPKIEQIGKSPVADLLEQLRRARTRHIQIVDSFDDSTFNRPMTPLWSTGDGAKLESPGWVATKTVQHTGEHTNTIFRFALFAPA